MPHLPELSLPASAGIQKGCKPHCWPTPASIPTPPTATPATSPPGSLVLALVAAHQVVGVQPLHHGLAATALEYLPQLQARPHLQDSGGNQVREYSYLYPKCSMQCILESAFSRGLTQPIGNKGAVEVLFVLLSRGLAATAL